MGQYLLIPFLGEWTSIYQLFWCSPGVQGFDTLPSISKHVYGLFSSHGWACLQFMAKFREHDDAPWDFKEFQILRHPHVLMHFTEQLRSNPNSIYIYMYIYIYYIRQKWIIASSCASSCHPTFDTIYVPQKQSYVWALCVSSNILLKPEVIHQFHGPSFCILIPGGRWLHGIPALEGMKSNTTRKT